MMNQNPAEQIAMRRKALGMTQAKLAEKLGVSFQAVSSWERGETVPELTRLQDIAEALQTSASALLESGGFSQEQKEEKLFDEEHMFTYIKSFASSRNMFHTLRALPFARQCHSGQTRKGSGKIPYIVHPLNIACHALAMGLQDDNIIAAALLHDVCEDCDILPEELPVNDTVRRAVSLLTFKIQDGETKEQAKVRYFREILASREAAIVKLLDRCNNVSFMVYGFSPEKMRKYIAETKKFVLPLLQETRQRYPEFYNACYLIKYHLCSVINSIEAIIA